MLFQELLDKSAFSPLRNPVFPVYRPVSTQGVGKLFRDGDKLLILVKALNGSRLAQGVIERKLRRGTIALKRNRDIANGKSDDILAL